MMTNRRMFLKMTAAGAAAMALGPWDVLRPAGAQGIARGKYNVLFIPVDDLRTQLGCYGDTKVHSPNIDRLAETGLTFTRAYCQFATCSPSRASLLTGKRPDTTQVQNLHRYFRDTIPDTVTLPELFKNNGYYCEGMGKVYHDGLDDPRSWSEPLLGPERTGSAAFARPTPWDSSTPPPQAEMDPYGAPDVADEELDDGKVAAHAIEVLREIKKQGREPFFLATGFRKPHLPFVAPKKYWDLYDEAAIELAGNPFAPQDAPEWAGDNAGELRSYKGVNKEGPMPEDMARTLIHGYNACVSYTDAQIGRLLDELERLEMADDTIVILWGDHGWKLGEHGDWGKHTNFENDTNAPVILRVPGMASAGEQSDALIEFVDIYPTLAALCGLQAPEDLEGFSFAPLVDEPARPWKDAAFSQWPVYAHETDKGAGMGYAMRTDRYRFIEWQFESGAQPVCELYDHASDPRENVNLAAREEYQALVEQLRRQLHAGWTAALPQ